VSRRADAALAAIDRGLAEVEAAQAAFHADLLYQRAFRGLCAVMEADGRNPALNPWPGPPLSIERYDHDARLDARTDERHRRTG